MSETLILLLGQTPEDPVRWAFMANGAIQKADIAETADELAAIAGRAARGYVAAILPGEQAAMRSMTAPPKAPTKFRAAAAYLIEDELAEGLETLHIAVIRRDNGAGTALAVKKSLIENWIVALAEAGLSPDLMTADFALLPLRIGRSVVVYEPSRITGAAGLQGFAGERPITDGLVKQLVSGEDSEETLAFGNADKDRPNLPGLSVDWRGGSDEASLFCLYTEGIQSGGAPNLRQGEYRKRRDWHGALNVWRRAAVLAAASIVLLAGVVVADGARLTRLAEKLNQETLALHQSAFPGQANTDPRGHARTILASESSAPAFLFLATQFAESLEENGQIQVDRIRYNAARGEFSISLRFSNIDDLENLKKLLAGRGVVAAEAGGVRRSGVLYVGELRVSTS